MPSFGDITDGFTVHHREYIKDIKSSVNFASETFELNPGVADTFPWGHKIAQQFEEYRFNGLIFYLKTNSATSVASTNTALGVWGAVTQYDPSNPPLDSKQACENYVGVASGVPCTNVIHAVECKPGANVLRHMYTRNQPVPLDKDARWFDWGRTQIFTAGSQSESVIGELWVSYSITYIKPKLPNILSSQLMSTYMTTGGTDTTPFGTPVRDAASNLDTSLTSDTLTLGKFCPAGNYKLLMYFVGSSFSMSSMAYITSANVTNKSTISAPQGSLANTTTRMYIFQFTKTNSDAATIKVTGPGGAGANGQVWVWPMPASYYSTSLGSQGNLLKLEIEELRKLVAKYRSDLLSVVEDAADTTQEWDDIHEPVLKRATVIRR